jgi:hypothetical protein
MSDMLERLIEAEKGAAGLVSAAETEGGQKVSRVRAEGQKAHTELLKRKAIETDAAVKAERDRVGAERERKNSDYREKLSRQSTDPSAFRATVLSLIE